MLGTAAIATAIQNTRIADRYGNQWQYHSRSDAHSKAACAVIMADLASFCPLLSQHIQQKKVGFGINHEMHDFENDRKKALDLVICTKTQDDNHKSSNLLDMLTEYNVPQTDLSGQTTSTLNSLERAAVGSVLIAIEAKACMTAHQRALPRLYDELNSSHLTVHGASHAAIAAGFVMINHASRYLSPDLNKRHKNTEPEWSKHNQPRDTEITIAKIRQLPRRSNISSSGYDALTIMVVDASNDGKQIAMVAAPPAPQTGDIYHYNSFVDRLSGMYATRFSGL